MLRAMAAPPAGDAPVGEQIPSGPPPADVLNWVREGERLFAMALQTLHHCEVLRGRADRFEQENRQLCVEMQALRDELHQLRSERIEAAESLRAIAEHVTRLATAALQRLSRPVA